MAPATARLPHQRQARGAWSVLQAIGVAGLITLALMRTGTLARLLAGLALLVAYQLVLDRFWLRQVLSASHGGLSASLGWGAMLLIATALADLFHEKQRGWSIYVWASSALLAGGVLASLVFPVSKNRVSLSYVLISVAISALVFLILDVLSRLVATVGVALVFAGEALWTFRRRPRIAPGAFVSEAVLLLGWAVLLNLVFPWFTLGYYARSTTLILLLVAALFRALSGLRAASGIRVFFRPACWTG